MLSLFRKPLLAICISLYLLCIMTSPSLAGMIGAVSSTQQVTSQESRDSEISKIQRALETQIVKSKLEAYGLTPDEITAKLQGMTDDQIHMLAQASNDVLAGGDGLGVVIAILLIILIVIVILQLTGHSVIIKYSILPLDKTKMRRRK
jgi:CHASE3 domain sensor protein